MTTCTDITPHLFGYQLGACERDVRDDIDAHLLGCSACLSTALAYKRVNEDGAAFDERPSPKVRHRLRSAVLAKRKPPVAVWVMAIAALAFAVIGTLWVRRPAPTLTDVTGLVDAPTLTFSKGTT